MSSANAALPLNLARLTLQHHLPLQCTLFTFVFPFRFFQGSTLLTYGKDVADNRFNPIQGVQQERNELLRKGRRSRRCRSSGRRYQICNTLSVQFEQNLAIDMRTLHRYHEVPKLHIDRFRLKEQAIRRLVNLGIAPLYSVQSRFCTECLSAAMV